MKVQILIAPEIKQPWQVRRMASVDVRRLPYGAGCLAAFLKRYGYDVTIKDMSFLAHKAWPWFIALDTLSVFKQIEDYLVRNVPNKRIDYFIKKMFQTAGIDKFDVIGFSVFSILNLPASLLLAKKIKEQTGAIIVFGGPLITKRIQIMQRVNKYDFVNFFKFIDYLVVGRGEEAFLKLLRFLKGEVDLDGVPNLVYRKTGKVVINRSESFDIEEMSAPDFDSLPLSRYKRLLFFSNRRLAKNNRVLQLPYQMTCGCTQNCSFCNFYLVSPKVEFKSQEKIISELIYLKDKYKTSYFYFCETKFNISYQYAENICDIFIKEKLSIHWRLYAGINNMDRKLLLKMKKAGCYAISWGIESGSDNILRAMNKGFSVKQAAKTLKDSHNAGIKNATSFMTGFVGETDKDVCRTLAFIKDNSRYIDRITLFDFGLNPATFVFDHPDKFGIEAIYPDRLSLLGASVIGWDEAGGLRWNDKLRQKRKAYRRAQRETNKIFYYRKLKYLWSRLFWKIF